MFDSLERSNAHFWSGFGIVATRIRGLGEDTTANVIDGVAYFGEGTTLAVAGSSRYLVRSFRMPLGQVQVVVLNTIMPPGARVFSVGSFVTMNPLRVARFSYRLVTGAIADVIPLAVRVDRDSRDTQAVRGILYAFTNRLYESRQEYYAGITLGMLQGCSGISLMLGYSNPWATLLRKQCEATAVAMQGVFDVFLAILIDVPFAKCLCVDAAARGANFETYAMDYCYYFAPARLKPLLFGMIQDAVNGGSTGIAGMCSALVEFASSSVSDSMKPYFTAQLQVCFGASHVCVCRLSCNTLAQANEQIGSSIDYLTRIVDPTAGRCMDFVSNPFATVLIPEPVDYFMACGQTSLCALKCAADFDAFEAELLNRAKSAVAGTSIVLSRSVLARAQC